MNEPHKVTEEELVRAMLDIANKYNLQVEVTLSFARFYRLGDSVADSVQHALNEWDVS